MHKDVRLATDTRSSQASPMPVCNLVREIFQIALNEMGSEADVRQPIHLYEPQSESGVCPQRLGPRGNSGERQHAGKED